MTNMRRLNDFVTFKRVINKCKKYSIIVESGLINLIELNLKAAENLKVGRPCEEEKGTGATIGVGVKNFLIYLVRKPCSG